MTEEVARWAFEVHVATRATGWFVAFTNPTAGPWKRVMAPNADGVMGEVHRFAREEKRPDLIVVSDALRLVLIIEAKPVLPDLLKPAQVTKSVGVVRDMATQLARRNPYWGPRREYVVVCGLLWGAGAATPSATAAQALRRYETALQGRGAIRSQLLGLECLRLPGEAAIGIRALRGGAGSDDLLSRAAGSLGVPVEVCN